MFWEQDSMEYQLIHGDCLDVMPTLKNGSVDCVISDPIYPCIDRDYGRMTEADWMDMMQEVVKQSRRVLAPTGSAVFILQPNSEKVGKMRLWLWKFMVWCGEEWNIVQDAYWWNHAAPPTVHTHAVRGLMRPSVKYSIWLGNETCYRNQDGVLLTPAESSLSDKRFDRHDLVCGPSGLSMRHGRALSTMHERGGSTPFNLVICSNTESTNSAGAHGHGAGTPLALADWWVRYIFPPGGTVLDMFAGTSTMGVAALNNGCNYIGIEKMRCHYESSLLRLEQAARENSITPVKVIGKATDTEGLPLFA
jgi:DNA modification methylase